MTISERIRTIAEKQKITIAQLERDLGFNKGTIRRWAESEPSVEKVCRVADYLLCSVDEICGRSIMTDEITKEFAESLARGLSDDENMIINKYRSLSDSDKLKLLVSIMRM